MEQRRELERRGGCKPAALSKPEASAVSDAWSTSSSVAEPAALSMPEASAVSDA